jgi:hypothetical protein
MNTRMSLAESTTSVLQSILPILLTAVLLVGCSFIGPSVGALQTRSQTIELAGGDPVRVEIFFGAGKLQVSGGAEHLLDADFTYNVAELKPQVESTDGLLVIRQPEVQGLPSLQRLSEFRNEWNLRLNNEVPMELAVDVGAGTIDLRPAGLSLTRLEIDLGATQGTIDLTGDWARDLEVAIDSGAANITVLLPADIGVHIDIDAGPTAIQTTGLTRDGEFYVNDAYGVSPVTQQIKLATGIGVVNLVIVGAE